MQPTKLLPECILQVLGIGPTTRPQLARRLKKRYDHVNTALKRLQQKGLVERVDSGQPPFLFKLRDVA